MTTELQARHRLRQGAILMLLLLGPAPIALLLAVLGTSTAAVTVVLIATAALVATILELYRRQRRDASAAGLPRLPAAQVIAFLLMLGGVGAATFLLPIPHLAAFGVAALLATMTIIYSLAGVIRRHLTEPDERCAVLILGLMCCLIALGNGCL